MFDTNIVAPLVFIDPNDESIATVVGIQSWTGACGDVNYPDVYASVAQALSWITQKTGKPINTNCICQLLNYFVPFGNLC